MQLLSFLYPALLALLLTPVSGAKKKVFMEKEAILLSKVKSLTLRQNAMTSHRRVSAIPQLTCKGPACRHHKIDIMRCTNTGASYNDEDIQWSCSASLPSEFKLGSTDVICEGYESADDDYVLKGSCGVEYRLLLTDEGEEKYGKGWFGGSKSKNVEEDNGWTLDGILFAILFVGVAVWIIWAAWRGARHGPRAPPRAGGGGGGWGGGGGGGPWDDPPPPYSGPKRYTSNRSEAGWRPGFWTGAAGGAAAGYMAGRAGNRQPEVQERGGGWFGGGRNSGSSFAGPSRSTSSSSSSARHESTGFGSTSRR